MMPPHSPQAMPLTPKKVGILAINIISSKSCIGACNCVKACEGPAFPYAVAPLRVRLPKTTRKDPRQGGQKSSKA